MAIDVNRIVEMALDFGEFDVQNPYDPEFHKTLAGQRVTVYYGTTNLHFWEVVKNGVNAGPTISRKHPNYNDLSLDYGGARDRARRLAYSENNHQFNGPVQPLVFVLETKFEKPYTPSAEDELEQFVAGSEIGAEMNSILPSHIPPKNITGVFYERMENAWETPIKKFIQKVNWGQIKGIEPDPSFKRGRYRPAGPTREAWQHVVLRYINDLLNYSSNYFQYLVGSDHPVPYNDTIIREATKIGLTSMLNWRGRDFMEWVYKILPLPIDEENLTKEEDINQVLREAEYNGWNKPFYQLWKKYQDDTTWEYRSGKKEPYYPPEQ